MKQVFKYEIPVDDQWHELVTAGPVLHVDKAWTRGGILVWAEAGDTRSARYRVYGTGHPIEGPAAHVGTVVDSPFVWHLYEAPGGTK